VRQVSFYLRRFDTCRTLFFATFSQQKTNGNRIFAAGLNLTPAALSEPFDQFINRKGVSKMSREQLRKYRIAYSLNEGCVDVAITREQLDRIYDNRILRADIEDAVIAQLHQQINFEASVNATAVKIVDDLLEEWISM
jgi:hypothetical protein